MSSLWNISSIDGRYQAKCLELADIVSEGALIEFRLKVELYWILHLSEQSEVNEFLGLDSASRKVIQKYCHKLPNEAAEKVKAIEATTNHDVKAVEYYLVDLLKKEGFQEKQLAFLHFACTSEDINNLSYAMMLSKLRSNIILPAVNLISANLMQMATDTKSVAMLSRTHGQSASPSTLGKEVAVYLYRLSRQIKRLGNQEIAGKINGAVGNFNAHQAAFPEVDWMAVSKSFIENKLQLNFNPLTTQIENHDTLIEFCDICHHMNAIMLGMCKDFWQYISLGYYGQKKVDSEVGSSTMPHKVNPIDFENAEGNFGLANSIFGHYKDKLSQSRMQRDLTDSTVLRSLGTAFGHSLVAYKSLQKGLGKLEVNRERLLEDLQSSPEVLTEAVQTVMRKHGIPDAYDRLKAFSRGQRLNLESIRDFIRGIPEIPEDDKKLLMQLTPESYTGIAVQLAGNSQDLCK